MQSSVQGTAGRSPRFRRAKRNKAFENSRFIGLAIDGATAGRCRSDACHFCRPFRNAKKEIVGYRHHFVAVSVVAADWLTNFAPAKVGSLSLYHLAKSRWEIENQGFNDAKNR